MWVVKLNNTCVGPFGTPDDVEGGRREAEEYAEKMRFGNNTAEVLPLTAPSDEDGKYIIEEDGGGWHLAP